MPRFYRAEHGARRSEMQRSMSRWRRRCVRLAHCCAKTVWRTAASIRSRCKFHFCRCYNRSLRSCLLRSEPCDFEDLVAVGEAIGRVIAASSEEILLLTTSDLNHYENDATTRVKDRKAIDQILALDARGLYDTCRNEAISMCGLGPTRCDANGTAKSGKYAGRVGAVCDVGGCFRGSWSGCGVCGNALRLATCELHMAGDVSR